MIAVRKHFIEIGNKIGCLGSLQPFVWWGNVFGIFSFKIVKNRIVPRGILSHCYIFVLFGARTYIGGSSLPSTLSIMHDLASWLAALATYLTQLIALIADYFITTFLEKRLIKYFDKLAIYDETVAKLGHRRKDRYAFYWFFIVLIIVFITDVTWGWVDYLKDKPWTETAIQTVYNFLHPVTRLLIVLKFDVFVHLIYQRFRHWNDSIISSVSWTRGLAPKIKHPVNFDRVMFLHATLLDASRIINDTYGLMLLCWFSNIFISTVSNIYRAKHEELRWLIAYYASSFVLIVTTCTVCNITAEEANYAGKKMSKDSPTLIEESTSMDRIRMQLYLVHNRVIFNAADLFVINLPLVYSIAVAIATYGILLTKISDSM